MDPRRCIRSDRFALFVGLCGLISLFYIASNYFDLKDNITIAKVRLLPTFLTNSTDKKTLTIFHRLQKFPWLSFLSNSAKNKTTISPSTITTSAPKTSTLYKAGHLQSGEELFSVRSNRNYPPFVKLDVVKSLSFQELKQKSYNFSFKTPTVATIIHQSWKVKTLPPRFVKWSNTWREKFPNYEYKLWTDSDNHMFVKTYFPWFWERYNRLTHPVQKADAVRYLYLFAQGGIYADLDDECLKNFEHLLKNYSVVFGAMDGTWYPPKHPNHIKEGYVQNSFMYSVPGHPLWLEVLDTILKRPPSSSAESTTGPFMLQEVIARWRRTHPQRERREMRIYEPVYFNPFSWITRKYRDCKDVNRMTSKDIAACKSHFTNSYVIQYHTQTWGRGAGNTNRNDRRRRI